MKTIHLVYPHGSRISCPDAIGRNVGQRLAQHYRVCYYEWDSAQQIEIGKNDVLVGHPHPSPGTCFRLNYRKPGWRRIIAICPYAHGDETQAAFLDALLPYCDLYLAVTGNYWFSTVQDSCYAHWFPKMRHLDLAIDRADFPVLKTVFNPPGKRRFTYIGHTRWYKNPQYLTKIAKALPEFSFSWIGPTRKRHLLQRTPDTIEGFSPLGFQNFSTDQGRQVIASHDFMITVGLSDPNPTTILESMAWGLIPVCSPQSGYMNWPGIVNIPVNDLQGAVEILRQLQDMPDETLTSMQSANWKALDEHFNWDRFTQTIIEAIESEDSPDSPGLETIPFAKKLKIRKAALLSPFSPLRPGNLARSVAKKCIRIVTQNKEGA